MSLHSFPVALLYVLNLLYLLFHLILFALRRNKFVVVVVYRDNLSAITKYITTAISVIDKSKLF